MNVLAQTVGLLRICEECGALLEYSAADLYEDAIYCPVCKAKNIPLYNPKYDTENVKK